MQSASSIWSNLLSNATVNIIEIVRNSVRGGEANVYESSYYWNFRTSSFKQVACLILEHDVYNDGVTSALCIVRWYFTREKYNIFTRKYPFISGILKFSECFFLSFTYHFYMNVKLNYVVWWKYFYEWNSWITFLGEKLTAITSGRRFSPTPTWRFRAWRFVAKTIWLEFLMQIQRLIYEYLQDFFFYQRSTTLCKEFFF